MCQMRVGNSMVSSIMSSVLDKQSNEMPAVHLVKTYCLPTLVYGCEAWTLSDEFAQI